MIFNIQNSVGSGYYQTAEVSLLCPLYLHFIPCTEIHTLIRSYYNHFPGTGRKVPLCKKSISVYYEQNSTAKKEYKIFMKKEGTVYPCKKYYAAFINRITV